MKNKKRNAAPGFLNDPAQLCPQLLRVDNMNACRLHVQLKLNFIKRHRQLPESGLHQC